MERVIIEPWRELSANERDILVALAVGGPASGTEIHHRIEGDTSRKRSTTHRHIQNVVDAGYVEQSEAEGKGYINRLTAEGERVVGFAFGEMSDAVEG